MKLKEKINEYLNDWDMVGTNDYKGYAYFWENSYIKFVLRDCSPRVLKKIHNKALNKKLKFSKYQDHKYLKTDNEFITILIECLPKRKIKKLLEYGQYELSNS